TASGPADYALGVGGSVLGIVEAKKITLGPQDALTQAERYARGLAELTFHFDACRAPVLHAICGQSLCYLESRTPPYPSRPLARFQSSATLRARLGRAPDAVGAALAALPNDHPRLRPYQREANAAVEAAIAARKRQMLVAMATGTGKTVTLVNQVYRLMRS